MTIVRCREVNNNYLIKDYIGLAVNLIKERKGGNHNKEQIIERNIFCQFTELGEVPIQAS